MMSLSAPTSATAQLAPTPRNSDPQLAAALSRLSPKQHQQAKTIAQDFEAMFLNTMFAQMSSGVTGDGPFGDTPSTGIWRGMLTEEHAKSFARSGGVGIADNVFRTLILQQAGAAQELSQ